MAARAGPTPFTYMREVERSIAEVYEPSVQGGGLAIVALLTGRIKQGSMRFTAEPRRTQSKRGEDKGLHTAGLRTGREARRLSAYGIFGGSDYSRDRMGVCAPS